MSDAAAALGKVSAAGRMVNAGNISGAERLLGEVLNADPEHPRANALMSLVLYHRGEMQEAVRQADVAIGLDPSAEAFRFKALALIRLKQRKASVEAAEAAVQADPTSAWAVFTLAIALENAKRLAEAETLFRRAVALDPASDVFRANLGRFLLRRGNFAEARSVAAELDPESTADTALVLRGELALRDGKSGEARDFALWVLSQNAMNEAALRLLVQTKAARNWVLGAWWGYAMFMANKPIWVRFAIILPIALLLTMVFRGFGYVFALYMLTCRLIFNRMVSQELKTVKLRADF